MNTSLRRTESLHLFLIIHLIFVGSLSLFAQAPNDNCANASEIIITNDNYGLGVFTSEIFNVDNATAESGTYFLSASGHDRDLWFSFELPTARYGKLELFQVNAINSPIEMGFITYLRSNNVCPPPEAWVDPAKLAPVPQQGSTDTECLDPGSYLVQVTLSPEATGQIYLELTLEEPFQNAPGVNPAYDHPSESTYLFSSADIFDIGCQTVESDTEFECLPTDFPEEMNQSLWWRFWGGLTPEYISVEFSLTENSTNLSLPESVGIRLFDGDVNVSDWETLPQVGPCKMLQPVEGTTDRMYVEFICEALSPDGNKSFALFFPGGYANNDVSVQVCKRGAYDTGAPHPVLSQMAPANILGVLPATSIGTTITFKDTLTCASSLSLPQNQCGTVNPPDFVSLTHDGTAYELEYTDWASFELTADSKVRFSFIGEDDYLFARIYNKGITNDCSNISVGSDLIAVVKDEQTLPCLPSGEYAIQVLGGKPKPEDWDCDKNMLGKRFRLFIKVTSENSINQFALNEETAYEKINDLNPLEPDVTYNLATDVFGCANTVQIAGGTCPDRPKIMVREFTINEPGLVRFKNLGTNPNISDFHHKLYAGSIAELAIAQNAFTDDEVILNAVDFLGGCIDDSGTGNSNFYCLSPGHYSFVTFGTEEQQGILIYPKLNFYDWTTQFDDPNNPEDLGDLTNQDTFSTQLDIFSCGNNPLTIGGLPPCSGFGNNVMQLYRVFYLSEFRRVKFNSIGLAPFNLFEGNIMNGANTLTPWIGDNINNDSWQTCSINQRTSDCDMLGPGYYTLVSYGHTASFDDPALNSPLGSLGTMGVSCGFELIIQEPEEVNCNRPDETCFGENDGITDWNSNSLNELCPFDTKVVYVMDTVYLNCVADTPFSDHPIEACATGDSRVAYFGFKLTKTSFVHLKNIPADYHVKIYAFNAADNPSLLVQQDPIYPCTTPANTKHTFCNVQPGEYTIVVFASYDDRGKRLVPVLDVDRVLTSRFDHWNNAYDFGIVPDNGFYIQGKEGDINPLNPDLAPSNDYISCQTSGSPTDPLDGLCCTEYNPLISKEPFNIQNITQDTSQQIRSLRNIIYTFQLQGAGECTAYVSNCLDPIGENPPHYAIYKSDSGAVPFETLQSLGGVDSTYTDGLELVRHSSDQTLISCDSTCTPLENMEVTFDKTSCEEYTSRYYLVVYSAPANSSNQQITLSLRYQSYPAVEVRFDEFAEAGSAVSEQTNPQNFNLVDGYQSGEAMSFQCATAKPSDPIIADCESDHTVWYRFTTAEVGRLHLAYWTNGSIGEYSTSRYLKLYKAGAANTVGDLEEVDQTDFPFDDPDNNTGSSWRRACIEPGDYYLFWEACGDSLGIFDLYQPYLYFEAQPGDYCSNAVPIEMDGVGMASNSLTIDCHTIGTEALDGPEGYDCLLGPEGYKSSFFVLNLNGPLKRDVTFSMTENTTADFQDIRYRVLPGYCGALTPGLCSSDPNTSFTLNCLGQGSYIIQIVTLEDAEGEITFFVEAVASPDQDCVPLDPLFPNADFTYSACEGDTIFFENQSTFGNDVTYEWTFPDFTTTESHPSYPYPRPDEVEFITVQLQVTNIVSGFSNAIEIEVEISPIVDPIMEDELFLCEDSVVLVTAQSYSPDATFVWSNNYIGPTVEIEEPGLVYVEVGGIRCPQYDSVQIVEVYCDSFYMEQCDSVTYLNNLIYKDSTFSHLVLGSPYKDTLRKLTVVINGIDQVILDPEYLDIEVGDEVELNAYTTADSPIFTWFPTDAYTLIREDKISVQPPRSIVYTLLVEDSDGCLREAESQINVEAIYNDVYIPNAFSPNGDGVNDYFHPFGGDHIVEVTDFRVFDRWGAAVFQNNNFPLNDWTQGWDGSVGGKSAGLGVYTYFVRVEYIDGVVVVFKGDVSLMR